MDKESIVDLRKSRNRDDDRGESVAQRTDSDTGKPSTDKDLLKWSSPEYIKNPNGAAWLVGIITVGAIIFFWSIYTLNFLLAVLIFVSVLTILVMARRSPDIVSFKVRSEGIWIGDKFHAFGNMDSFWVFDFANSSILSLKPKSHFGHNMHIILRDVSSQEVRGVLEQYLPEEEQHYSIVDWLSEQLHV